VRELEAEVARLQQLDAAANSERNALAIQNNSIKEFLAAQSIELQVESMNLDSTYQGQDELSQLGGATVNFRHDEAIGEQRWFLDLPEASDTIGSTSRDLSSQPDSFESRSPVTVSRSGLDLDVRC